MKTTLLLFFLALAPYLGQAQELFYIQFEDNDVKRLPTGTEDTDTTKNDTAIFIGGLNNWDGGGNYINVFGTKLIIDRLDFNTDGTRSVVLRREDGDNFFNHLDTVNAKLIPVAKTTEKGR